MPLPIIVILWCWVGIFITLSIIYYFENYCPLFYHHRQLKALAKQFKSSVENSDDEFHIGYRYAYIVQITHKNKPMLAFGSIWKKAYFQSSEYALCMSGKSHPVPGSSPCRCGFHAVDNPRQLPGATVNMNLNTNKLAVLQVRLSGKHYRSKRGYRAARQDVLSVGLPCRCFYCNRATDCFVLHIALANMPNAIALVPACAADATGVEHTFSLNDLRQQLGTEVYLLPDFGN